MQKSVGNSKNIWGFCSRQKISPQNILSSKTVWDLNFLILPYPRLLKGWNKYFLELRIEKAEIIINTTILILILVIFGFFKMNWILYNLIVSNIILK